MFQAQLRATGLALRTDLIAGGLLLAVLAVLLDFDVFRGAGLDFDLTNVSLQLFVVSLFAPMSVWKGDEPSRRDYHWSLPVERGPHTLAKVLGGGGWVLGLAGVYLLAMLTAALLTGGGVQTGGELERELMARSGAAFDAQDLTFHGHSWLWLVPCGGVLVAYLLGSIVALSTDHPWRVFGGVTCVMVILAALSVEGALQTGPVGPAREFLLTGPYSLHTLLTGTHAARGLSAGSWATAVMIWGSFAAAGVMLAAFHRQER